MDFVTSKKRRVSEDEKIQNGFSYPKKCTEVQDDISPYKFYHKKFEIGIEKVKIGEKYIGKCLADVEWCS